MKECLHTATSKLLTALALLLILFLVSPADAEYIYQYTDDNGNVFFTDNPGNVPESKRSKMERHRSSPATAPDTNRSDWRERQSTFNQRSPSTGGTWEINMRREAESLDRERAALKRQFKEIITEGEAMAPPPPPSASSSEKSDYKAKVETLNRRIDAYERRRKAFDERVSKFQTDQ